MLRRIAPLLLLWAMPLAAQVTLPIRVHCGGPAYTDSKGNQWQADANFVGGGAYSQAATIAGTSDPALFQTIRYAQPGNNFIYTFPVPNGSYTINLSFAELWIPVSGRKFNVQVNGRVVLNNFDVYAKAGQNVADVETINAAVASGSIVIELDALSGNGFLDAIEILPVAPPTPPVLTMISLNVKVLLCTVCNDGTNGPTDDSPFNGSGSIAQTNGPTQNFQIVNGAMSINSGWDFGQPEPLDFTFTLIDSSGRQVGQLEQKIYKVLMPTVTGSITGLIRIDAQKFLLRGVQEAFGQ